ncbi:hypothetical protein MLD38_030277 [Melastoma candidum]|uniref:Uncharacterized protein n=1 Tax=Melastoma candidum TaxID=119954 RepID=A0ACB9MLS3_9MYRT|nr:hypothetical protein MLD38_030277 [Melastoma candidum]
MHREEKKRKFHEAVVNMLFPPSIDDELDDDDSDIIPTERHDNSGDDSSSLPKEDIGDDGNTEFQNKQLTRAQRKRIRKKRLKEESIRRGKMIGPLVLLNNGDGMCSKGGSCGVAKDDALDIQNDQRVGYDAMPSKIEAQPIRDCSKKLKQRRAAKRQAKDAPKSSECDEKDGSVD